MGTFLVSLQTVLPLFLVILIGVLFSKTKVSSASWIEVLNKYVLWIGFPALVIGSLLSLESSGQEFIKLIIHNSVYTISCMLLAFPIAKIFRLSGSMLRSLFIILPFGNFAYLGIPVLQSAFGDEMLPAAAILSAVYLFWLLTLGIVLVEALGDDKIHTKKLVINLLQNPLLISVFVGLAIVFLKIDLPIVIEKTIHLFSDSVTSVVLFSLGMFMGTQNIGGLKEWIQTLGLVVVTMLILPLCFFLYLQTTTLDSTLINASVLDSAMPLGLTPYILIYQYKLKAGLAARIIVLGTFLSIFILPLWMVILG